MMNGFSPQMAEQQDNLFQRTLDKLPLDRWVDNGLEYLTTHYAFITKGISEALDRAVEAMVTVLMSVQPWVIIMIVALIAWRYAGNRVAIFAVIGLSLVWNLELWEGAMQTLTLVTLGTLIAVILGMPLGILAALSPRFHRVITPVLDFMQTMPAFVYLIPGVAFFGLGTVAGMVATIIFSMPPSVRLTALGILQVPKDLTEAADAFGATKWQKLFKIQLPLAVPTIMAGINQTIMLALSMVVIAAMIGAEGLGATVWEAIQQLESGTAFEAGIAIVILAMILDRITQKIGKRSKPQSQ